MAADWAQEVRAHATGAETWGTAADGAREARAHAMGAETWGMAADGARDGLRHGVSSTSVLCEILVLRSGTCLSQCQ